VRDRVSGMSVDPLLAMKAVGFHPTAELVGWLDVGP
jgi:hypothetical protein